MKLKLHTQIFVAIIAGVAVGIFFRNSAVLLSPIGDIFIRLLTMITVPLVFASLVMGMKSLGNIQQLGRIGLRVFTYFISTTLLAVLLGLVLVNVIKPGLNASPDLLGLQREPVQTVREYSIREAIVDFVPDNVIKAMVESQMVAVIFFSIILGSAVMAVGRKADGFVKAIDGLNEVLLKITDWLMKLAPIGVFSLMATLVAQTGFSAFRPLLWYTFTVIIGLILHSMITLNLILFFMGKYSPVIFLKKMFPALATAFSTDSSLATLPVTMDTLERKVGISNKVAGFVAPLGATVNMDGTALYEAVAAIFIAQLFGVELTVMQQVFIVITATLASIGAAGIPSAGLVTMVMVLRSVNLPLEGIGLILAVDRILDMCRTVVNVYGDACGAVVVAKLEGEKLAGQ